LFGFSEGAPPVGCRRVHSHRFSHEFPQEPPILPIDSAIEPNIQAALEAPRFTKKAIGGCDVSVENRIPKEVRDALAAKGHKLEVLGDFSGDMGGGQAVVHDSAKGVNWGASDPRKDGAAVPEPHPYFK